MKRFLAITGIFFFVLLTMGTTFTSTYDTATPLGSDNPSLADDRMREIKAAVQERENVDHYWPLTGTEVSDASAGQHRYINFYNGSLTDPNLHISPMTALAELVFTDANSHSKQITRQGELYIIAADIDANLIDDSKIRLRNNYPLIARNAAGTGDVHLIKAGTDNNSVLPDKSRLDTSAAPVDDDDIANKKYVDDQIAVVVATLPTAADQQSYPLGSLTIKRGVVTGAQNTNASVTFGAAFGTACLNVILTPRLDSATPHTFPIHLRTMATTGFTFCQPNGTGGYTDIQWLAIGY